MFRLTEEKVAEFIARGKKSAYPDGGCLYLITTPKGCGSWGYRYFVDGHLRSVGLGSVRDWTLAEARERVRQCRRLRAAGIDPGEHFRIKRNAARAAVAVRSNPDTGSLPMATASREPAAAETQADRRASRQSG